MILRQILRHHRLDNVLKLHNVAQRAVSTEPIRVSAMYEKRSADVGAIYRLGREKWSSIVEESGVGESLGATLDRDWVIFSIPTRAYADEDSGPEGSPFVHVSASRRGSVVVVNTLNLRNERHNQFAMSDLLHETGAVDLPSNSGSNAREELLIDIVGDSVLGGDRWCEMKDGRLLLRDLDVDSVRIINSCMAQTVNLQFFESQVDQMYDLVGAIHHALEEEASSETSWFQIATQSFRRLVIPPSAASLESTKLFRHLAAVNSIANSVMLSGLRATIRPGSTAWKGERYAELQELLWEELDLEERYAELQRKLRYVDDTIRYSLDVAKDAKFILLERLIVLLIFAELVTSSMAADLHIKLPQLMGF